MDRYDSSTDTNKHISTVKKYLSLFIEQLNGRANNHDKTKLEEPEKPIFDEYTPKLAECTYGSDEYNGYLKEMNVALKHHYASNRHHPEWAEHFIPYYWNNCPRKHNGSKIYHMSLIDLVEMIADWKAASLRHNDGDILKSIEINQKRFGYSDELKQILLNTVNEYLFKYVISWGCCDGRDGFYAADSIEKLHSQIDEDISTTDSEKDIFKYGYSMEFKGEDYYNSNITIDNGLGITWKVNILEENI